MKNIAELDANFKPTLITADDVVYYNALSEPFEIRGLYNPYESDRYMRLPAYFDGCKDVSERIGALMYHTAGGRVRFVTDSPYIAIVAEVWGGEAMRHMTGITEFGFDMYTASVEDRKNPSYTKSFIPPTHLLSEHEVYDGFYEFGHSKLREITINFPMYSPVHSLMIGLKDGCTIKKAEPYTVEKPIVFYGSSVTQGGCATRPGTVYTSLLSRWLDADHINLGFSGNDKGEPALAEHIATLPMSAYVHAYGYNAPSLEHYQNTYYPFYKIIRDKNPDLPIVMMSTPFCQYFNFNTAERFDKFISWRVTVMEAYLKAYAEGDRNVYFVDGSAAIGGMDSHESTVDGVHPNDIGFYNMAKALYPLLKLILEKK